MPNISLGAVMFTDNPSDMTMIRQDKPCAALQTYSSVAYFSWDPTIIGKRIDLEWEYMPTSEFDALDVLFRADDQVVFNPQISGEMTYNVNILSLDGKYPFGVESASYRKDVKLGLLIMSEVS